MSNRQFLLAILILVITVQFSFAENVSFKSNSKNEDGTPLMLTGILTKPEGNGPFPAVVLLHGAAGIDDANNRDKACVKRLVSWGYITLQVDSFGPRGINSVVENPMRLVSVRPRDAYDAKSFLASLSLVDQNKIAVMGWSHGGWTILKAVSPQNQVFIPTPIEGQDTPFAAAIAFYPYCDRPLDSNTPLLILIGQKDDWAPASSCSFYMPGESGYFLPDKPQHEVILKIYQDAYHDFDWPGVENTHGHILKYDPDATADAAVRVKDFLSKHLK